MPDSPEVDPLTAPVAAEERFAHSLLLLRFADPEELAPGQQPILELMFVVGPPQQPWARKTTTITEPETAIKIGEAIAAWGRAHTSGIVTARPADITAEAVRAGRGRPPH